MKWRAKNASGVPTPGAFFFGKRQWVFALGTDSFIVVSIAITLF
jgi:hypothetical protein